VPVSIVASVSSIRVWASCVTEYLMEGMGMWSNSTSPTEIEQIVTAMSQARFMVRTSARDQLHGDALHGADLQLSEREFEKGTWRSKQYCAAIAFGATRVLTHCRFQTNGTTLVTNAQHPTSAPDAKAEVRRAVASLKENAPDAGSTTSDLSIDEELNLHSIGWEPVNSSVVCRSFPRRRDCGTGVRRDSRRR